ncbi:MAG: TonB-dependent receptor, partial [Acidobacteriales bacterium]|nr:TonB-dependent receptor [Terriglobales bacterium]
LLWTPSAHQSVWAAVTQAIRTPSRIEEDIQLTQFAAPSVYALLVGNRNLKPEALIGYEAGYRQLFTSNVYVDFSAFYNHYSHLIGYGPGTLLVETSPPPPFLVFSIPLENAMKGNTYGFEVAPDWKPTPWWRLRAAYSYLDLSLQETITDSISPSNLLLEGSSPRNQITVQSFFNLPHGFEFDPTYRYVSALGKLQIPAYHTADVRFGWRFAHHFEISAAGENLFQPHHFEFPADAGPTVGIKRSAYAQMTWQN